jgi:hypothetical protein
MVSDCGAGSAALGRLDQQNVQLELLSLHVPKAFGTSLAEVLLRHYGRHRIVPDYGVFIEAVGAEERMRRPVLPAGTSVVHGHFPVVRYADVAARRRAAFIRDPVRRTISHFFFWQAEPRHGNPLHDRMLDERLGLLEFAKLPAIRRFYSETIFGGCDLASFDLIGVVEELDRDWPRFQYLTGITQPFPHLNSNRYPGYQEISARIVSDHALMSELRRILADDIAFYARFL